MKYFIIESPLRLNLEKYKQSPNIIPPHMEMGWGNGYVVIPASSYWSKVDYADIPVSVHYGLSFGARAQDISNWKEAQGLDPDDYVIGFDTGHYQDNMTEWPKEAVEQETLRLRRQVIELCYPILSTL